MSKSKVDLVIVTPGTTGTDDSSDSERSSSAGDGPFHLDEMIVGDGHDDIMHPSTVILTAKSMVISLILVVIVGFVVGTVARNHLLNSIAATTRLASAYPYSSCSVDEMSSMELHTSTSTSSSSLPSIRLFNSNDLYEEATPLVTIGTSSNAINQIMTIISTASPSSTHDDDHNEEDELPSGQHLMIDMKDVDSTFLNSKEHIASAMVNLIKDNDMEMVLRSYHCSSDDEGGGGGVTCFGVLDEGHISIRTWPIEGVLIMDVFTFGKSDELISLVDTITKLFAIQEQMSDNDNDVVTPVPSILWSHRLRGFRDGFANYKRYTNPLETDLGADMLKMHYLDKKVQLVSAQTMFQHVDIYEVMNSNGCVGKKRSMAKYEQSLLNDGSYESLHREMYQPDKILYLDGVLQSTYYGDAAYHEALVHPPMITHPNPKRVAIIGGGEGATLREVLKHNTIEEVVMIEIDGELVGMCREHLPEWSDCSDFIGSDANSCFDDTRANVSFQDAFGWFITNFGGDSPLREKFDVIIMDALDPDKFVEIVGALYKDDAFTISLFKALSDDGIFIVQMGSSVEHDDPSLEIGPTKDTQHFMNTLEKVGFESMTSYDEGGRSGFYAPWSYLICFKSSKSRASWYDTSAAINIKLHQRIHKTKSGKPTLLYFDGPTMVSYQLPARSNEIVDCRKLVTPWECKGEYNGIDPKTVNPMARLEDHKKGIIDQNPMGAVISPLFERKSKQILAKINGPIVR